ncbi:hypothetical protein ACFWPQ_34955 [Streptomyces sp. NPDC058464]
MSSETLVRTPTPTFTAPAFGIPGPAADRFTSADRLTSEAAR